MSGDDKKIIEKPVEAQKHRQKDLRLILFICENFAEVKVESSYVLITS